MAGMFGADNSAKAMMQDLEDVASMYSQAKPASDDGIMKAPQGDQIDAGSWWAWLSGATRQKAKENAARVQEELSKMGVNTGGTSPQYQQELLDGILQARQYRKDWGITESLSDKPKWLEQQGDFSIPEQSEVTTEELPPMDEEASLADRLSNIQYVAYRGDTDPETGQPIQSVDDVANERMAEMASQGLMSRSMNGKDGDIAAYDDPFKVSEDELYNFAKEAFPDNDLAAGALLATIEAESAGGNSMIESGNYSKEAALRVANQGKFKTARKNEVEKIFKDPNLTYVDSKGITRMTKEGQVKFFNIYYNDKYRGDKYKMGNTEEGDGFRFRGRGPIQLTGRNNYKKYGDMIGVDLVQNPHLVVTDKNVALAVTRAFMKDKGLDNVNSAKGLRNIVGHADDAKLTKAKARWKRAKEIQRTIMRETSPRPRLRPNTMRDTSPRPMLRPTE